MQGVDSGTSSGDITDSDSSVLKRINLTLFLTFQFEVPRLPLDSQGRKCCAFANNDGTYRYIPIDEVIKDLERTRKEEEIKARLERTQIRTRSMSKKEKVDAESRKKKQNFKTIPKKTKK